MTIDFYTEYNKELDISYTKIIHNDKIYFTFYNRISNNYIVFDKLEFGTIVGKYKSIKQFIDQLLDE